MDERDAGFETHAFSGVEKAAHLMEIGRYDLAERELRGVIAHDPNTAYWHVQLGWALDGQEKRTEAEQEGKTALALDPESIYAMVLLGKIALETGRHVEAERHFLEALRVDPTSSLLYQYYGILMHRTGHLDKAERLLRKSLELDPENATVHGALSLVLAERQKGRQAKAHGELGVHLGPDDDTPHALLGYTYLATGHPFKARQHLREALRRDPSDSDVEEAFLEADRATRWVYLPMYYWSLAVSRLPGRQFGAWGIFLVLTMGLRSAGAPRELVNGITLAYVLFAIYTWVAAPLAAAWIKLRPPR